MRKFNSRHEHVTVREIVKLGDNVVTENITENRVKWFGHTCEDWERRTRANMAVSCTAARRETDTKINNQMESRYGGKL